MLQGMYFVLKKGSIEIKPKHVSFSYDGGRELFERNKKGKADVMEHLLFSRLS